MTVIRITVHYGSLQSHKLGFHRKCTMSKFSAAYEPGFHEMEKKREVNLVKKNIMDFEQHQFFFFDRLG